MMTTIQHPMKENMKTNRRKQAWQRKHHATSSRLLSPRVQILAQCCRGRYFDIFARIGLQPFSKDLESRLIYLVSNITVIRHAEQH